ncbi:DUF6089 family protein [Pedobacter sp. Leaf194]|uniref:type IX secretion system protein PorG n=1 Tax=Pedobacter sp. Leaf194 TaxID=1736297 RepID=UPI0007038FB3|nr:DUF6089 family protein [Pedobacter sp. Leaf194]KQS42047.1 hypothetical protein ASG14_06335 [Pedobacter sp. Leaf194]
MALNKPVLFILLLVSIAQISKAQSFATWEIGVSAGGAGYMGDLNQNNPVKISGVNAGIFVKHNFSSYLGVRLNYNYGQIQASDADSNNEQFRERNLSFKTGLNEGSAIFDFNFFDYKINGGNRRFTPYLFAGVGLINFKPEIKYQGTKYRLDRLATEGQVNGYSNTALTIPYGGGIRYNYKDAWSIFSEIGYRTAFTDYIDDVSGVYPVRQVSIGDNPSLNISDPSLHQTGAPGVQRGDFRKRDTYLFVSVGISFTFVSSKCYSF